MQSSTVAATRIYSNAQICSWPRSSIGCHFVRNNLAGRLFLERLHTLFLVTTSTCPWSSGHVSLTAWAPQPEIISHRTSMDFCTRCTSDVSHRGGSWLSPAWVSSPPEGSQWHYNHCHSVHLAAWHLTQKRMQWEVARIMITSFNMPSYYVMLSLLVLRVHNARWKAHHHDMITQRLSLTRMFQGEFPS